MRRHLKFISLVTTTLIFTFNQYPLHFTSHFSSLTVQAQTTEEKQNEALQLLEQGTQLYQQNKYPEALEIFQRLLVIVRELRENVAEGVVLYQIGTVYRSLGEYPKALDYFQQALPLLKEAGNKPMLAAVFNNIGFVYFNSGDYSKALEFYQQSLAFAKEENNKEMIVSILDNIGKVYNLLGQYKQAAEFYLQSLVIAKEIGNKEAQGTSLNNLGGIFRDIGEAKEALKYFEQALAIFKEIGNIAYQGTTLNNIGLIYLSLGEYPKSIEFFEQSLAINKQVGDNAMEGRTLNNIALAYFNLGQYPKSLESFQQALIISRQLGDKLLEGKTLDNMGQAFLLSGKFAESEKAALASIQVWENMRPGLTDADKVSIFETQAQTYLILQKALIAQNKIEPALEIAERGRARAFVELLAKKIAADSPNKFNIKPLNIDQVKQIAKQRNATIVEYSIFDLKDGNGKQFLEPEIYIWVIKPTGEIAFRSVSMKSLNKPLQELVVSSRDSIGVRGRGIAAQARVENRDAQNENFQQLHQLLIEPIANLLPTDTNAHVIFIPQGELFLVPFAALQDSAGKYLIEKHTILTAPAIQVLDLTSQRKSSIRNANVKEVLVVGNPTMPSLSLVPGEKPQQLPSLPGAEKEAIAIAQMLNTKAIIGNKATKTSILQQISQARLIHFATHGLLDEVQGMPGAIALAPSGNDNGLLTASEILDLNLNAELVVLSACDTGRGTITGDGVIGLSRSLISAGVPSVLVSLWAVPDAPTASLMTEFYQNLQKQPDKALALRQAMLTTMKNYPNPRDWAAFTLIGEAE